jgi:hypothetical protein
MRLAKNTLRDAHLYPALRCACGRTVNEHSLDLDRMRLRIICTCCHETLADFPISVIDDGGERR